MATVPKKITRLHKPKERKRIKERSSLYDSTSWRKVRDSVLLRDKFKCVSCNKAVGEKRRDYAIDHIQQARYYKGSFFDTSNLQTLCSGCHATKSAKEE